MNRVPNLFTALADPRQNLLPCGGEVYYFGKILTARQSDLYFHELINGIKWKNDSLQIYGKTIISKRQYAWHADGPFNYAYSGVGRIAEPWTDTLLELRKIAEEECGINFNSCLLNLYHDGAEGMAWHSDDEKLLGDHPPIASISLGAERNFAFRHKQDKQRIDVMLSNGSLLLMKGECQKFWQHSLPKSAKVKSARINLTFRNVIEDSTVKF